jgi:hypothetical protein
MNENVTAANGCEECQKDEPCGKYHVYVLELEQDGGRSRNDRGFVYVGQTAKTILQRLKDNWTKYGYRSSGAPPLIRKSFMRFRMDLVPRSFVSSETRDEAERKEEILADRLRQIGFRVKGPRVRA